MISATHPFGGVQRRWSPRVQKVLATLKYYNQTCQWQRGLLENEALLGQFQHFGNGVREYTNAKEGEIGGFITFFTSQAVYQTFELRNHFLDGLKVRSKEQGVIYVSYKDHALSVVHSLVKSRNLKSKFFESLL